MKMKKLVVVAIIFFIPFVLYAQEDLLRGGGIQISAEYVRIFASIVVLYLIITFILAIIKSILDFRLKSRMVDKGVSDKVVEQFLQPQNRDSKTQAIKAFLILAGIGVGLTAINFTSPIGIHSFAIMAFSIALSFLGYFYFIKRSEADYARRNSNL
jgi:hypothetical protein